MKKYDLIAIGGGSGGIAGARRAASYGSKVAVCEKSNLGGTCVNLGCVPKKLLYYASEFSDYFKDAKNYGWDIAIKGFDWGALIENKNKEVERLSEIYQNLLDESGVDIIRGEARFLSDNEILVGGKKLQADKFLIATGGRPFIPNIKGKEYVTTSNDIFHLKELPKEMVIVGGGYVGIEFASIMNGLGVEVTMIIRGKKILNGFDEDARCFLMEEIEKKGISIKCDTEISEITESGRQKVIKTKRGEIQTDLVMYATGRKPDVEQLGLVAAGVEIDEREYIKVDGYCRTSVKNIWAVGDVNGGEALTPIAINEARAFADTEFGKNKRKIDHSNVPSAVFSNPGLASVGLSEEQAKKNKKVKIYQTSFKPLKNTISGNKSREFMKILVDASNYKVLGVHIVGKDSAEIVQLAGVALKCGATKKQFDDTIGVHPSSAEELVTMR